MTRSEALTRLRSHADAVRAMGATAMYLYGSASRSEATASSDVDVYIEYDRAGRFNAFDLVGIKLFLEDQLDVPIDLTTRDSLHPLLREQIEGSAVKVF